MVFEEGYYMKEVVRQATQVVEDYIFSEITEAKSMVDTCGCNRCVFHFNSLLSFMGEAGKKYKAPYPRESTRCHYSEFHDAREEQE